MTAPIPGADRFVGRSAELARLRAAVVNVAQGTGGIVVVTGGPGIGKTALVGEVGRVAEQYGLTVARSFGIDDEGMPPMWPWLRLGRALEPLGVVLGRAERMPREPGETASATRFAMFDAVAEALSEIAPDPGLVVIFEDLHWFDATSMLLLDHVARAVADRRVLLVCTSRDDYSTHAAGLPLSGLSASEILDWIAGVIPDLAIAEYAQQLRDATGGNPLFVKLLVRRALATGQLDVGSAVADDPAVRALALEPVAALDPAVRDLLGTASVVGEELDVALLADLTALGRTRIKTMLDDAVRVGALTFDTATATTRFAHSLVRDAAYADLSPSDRRAVHRACADALSVRGDECAAAVAVHLRRAGDLNGCARWARIASAAARTVLAYDEAVDMAKLACESAPSVALLLELAEAEFVAGHIDSSVERCEAVVRLALQSGQREPIAAAASIVRGVGNPDLLVRVDRMCATALDRVDVPPSVKAGLLAGRAIAAAETERNDDADRLSAEAMTLAQEFGDADAVVDAVRARHLALADMRFVDERRALALLAIRVAPEAGRPLAALWGHVWLIQAALQTGDLECVDEEIDRVRGVADETGFPLAWWHYHRLRATRAALAGDLPGALIHDESATSVGRSTGDPSLVGLHHAFLGQLAAVRGALDLGEAETVLAGFDHAPDIPLVRVYEPLLRALSGDATGARAAFEPFRALPKQVGRGPRWTPLMVLIGTVAVLLDDAETARAVSDRLDEYADYYMCDGSGALFCGGSMARVLGDMESTTGRHEEAMQLYARAIAANDKIGARPFAALSRLGLARVMLASGIHHGVRSLLEAALAEFTNLCLPVRAESARVLLQELERVDPLTPRERAVAAAVGEGLTNRQIAERFFLSERTVESHVRSILGKLGCARRAEIAGAWREM